MKTIYAIFCSAMLIFAFTACEDKNQQEEIPSLSLLPSDPIQFSAAGGVKTIAVITNMATWDVASSQTWCVVTKTTDGKSFTVSATNYVEKPSEPDATVTVTAKSGSVVKAVTLSVKQSGSEVEPFVITLSDTDAQSVKMGIVPADKKARYYFGVISNKDLQSGHSGNLAAYITSAVTLAIEQHSGNIEKALSAICSVGDNTSLVEKLVSNADYTAFVVGLGGDGKASTRIVKQEFKTLDVTFLFSSSNVTTRSATVSVVPTLTKANYIWDVISQDDYDQNKENMNGFVENYVYEVDDYGSMIRKGIADSSFLRQFVPDSKYFVWGAYMDGEKKVIGEVITQEAFVTLVAQPNPAATMTVTIDKYFNGDDLYAKDPVKYKRVKGKVVVPVVFAANSEQSIGWYGAMLFADANFSIFDMYGEEYVLEIFVSQGYGKWNAPSADYYCYWGLNSASVLGVDANDNFGPFYHQDYTFTKEGASPISEYVPMESKSVIHAPQMAQKWGAKSDK